MPVTISLCNLYVVYKLISACRCLASLTWQDLTTLQTTLVTTLVLGGPCLPVGLVSLPSYVALVSGGHQWSWQQNGRPLLCYSGGRLPYQSLLYVHISPHLHKREVVNDMLST